MSNEATSAKEQKSWRRYYRIGPWLWLEDEAMSALARYEQWREQHDEEEWARVQREHRWDRLAAYNGEVARGLIHTPAYDAKMAREQERFIQEQQGKAGGEG